MITDLETRTPMFDLTLADSQTVRQYPPGTVLFEGGKEPAGVYIVHSGTIDLLYRAGNSQLRRLSHVSAGNILGLSSVVSHRPHDYTARVRKSSTLGFIDRKTFLSQLHDSPAMWLSVLRLLSHDVNDSYDSLRAGATPRP